ncbi:MAG: IS91 family transposase [Anaerolineae bacterium]|nr:IS91 family transposase [Anaerolineae bacterium]
MADLAEIFRQHGPAYREKFKGRIPASHLKAMAAIEQCRTEALGGHVYQCDPPCHHFLYSYHSCKNRHCPKSQNDAGQQWLARQTDLLLPVPYFMVTFTLPEGLRALARRNQRQVYDLLFQTSAAALQGLAADPRFAGGQPGFLGVLQTWTRDLTYHPHLHYLVPGGGLSTDGQSWYRARNAFFVHVKPLSRLFRAKFRAALQQAGLAGQVPPLVWRQEWVVHCQPVGTGQAVLKYLAPYIFHVALSNRRILKGQDGQVTFRYRDNARHWQTRTLPAEEFIRRFSQHVLPKGFQKVRYYGFFAPGQRHRLQQVRHLLGATSPPVSAPAAQAPAQPPGPRFLCPTCGRPMRRTQTLLPLHCRSP